MYRRKKIALFISHIYGYYQSKLCDGIMKSSAESGFQVDVFATNDGEDLGDYGQGEFGVLHLPRPNDYDGIILASGTYLIPALRDELADLFTDVFCCPVIDINQKSSSFPRIELDNNSPFEDMVCHLIQKHGIKNPVYLGISSYPEFNQLRKEAFLRGLSSLNYPTENTIYHCAEMEEASIENTLEELLKYSPDAIVCYNDNVALTVISCLKKKKIAVPEQIAVTGCDNIALGQNSVPTLTTISFPIEQIGETAIQFLSNAMHGMELPPVTTITSQLTFGESCGCSTSSGEAPYLARELEQYQQYMERSYLFHMQMSANLQGVTDLDEGIQLLSDYIRQLPDCREFYLCLYENWNVPARHIRKLLPSLEEEYDSDTVMLKLGFREGNFIPECTFTKRSLLPSYLYDSNNSWYIYCPLFFGSKLYGYIALSFYHQISTYPFIFLSWLMNVNNMLKDICDKKELGLLVERLENIYKTDELTGLLNRQGFKAYATPALEKAIAHQEPICSIMADLDCLKKINDTYGHQEGDFAIRVLAHAIENSVGEHCFCVRRGGDEFHILSLQCTEEDIQYTIEHIRKYLNNYNRLNTKPYLINASFGYAMRTLKHIDELNDLLEQADKNMYEEKNTKNKTIQKG